MLHCPRPHQFGTPLTESLSDHWHWIRVSVRKQKISTGCHGFCNLKWQFSAVTWQTYMLRLWSPELHMIQWWCSSSRLLRLQVYSASGWLRHLCFSSWPCHCGLIGPRLCSTSESVNNLLLWLQRVDSELRRLDNFWYSINKRTVCVSTRKLSHVTQVVLFLTVTTLQSVESEAARLTVSSCFPSGPGEAARCHGATWRVTKFLRWQYTRRQDDSVHYHCDIIESVVYSGTGVPPELRWLEFWNIPWHM
jgi:hypothetical protein